jgi:integrative and conjugative element protein (TIGR02256 family)
MSDVFELQRVGRIEVRGAMMAATRTTTVTGEDGKPEQLTAGVSRVAAGHWLTTRYPELFVPEPPRGKRRTAQRPRCSPRSAQAPAPKRPTWRPLVRLDTRTTPTVTVPLTRRAYLDITDQAFGQRGQVETGGALFGIPAKDGAPKIRRAGSPGPNARASRSSMHPDLEHTRREALEAERDGRLDRWIGSWHTHPSADGLPSDSDLRFFAWDLRELHHVGRGQGDYIGLIVTPKWKSDYARGCHLSWVKPTLNAWRMYAVAEDQFICTRAELVRC